MNQRNIRFIREDYLIIEHKWICQTRADECLNPCCNGIYLIMFNDREDFLAYLGLNPCCNGIYLIISLTLVKSKYTCLNPCCNGIYLIIYRAGT